MSGRVVSDILLAQQPCNNTVNMITIYCSIMFKHNVTAWRIDRGCSSVLECAKPDLIQQPSSWLTCCNIAVQSYYFIIPWQHVLSCMNMAVDLSWWFQQRCSSLFVHQAMNMQSVPTRMNKPVNNIVQAGQLNHVQAGQFNHVQARKQANTSCVCLRV